MRKIILSVAVSLDGFIEGPNGEYDWCPPPTEDGMREFLESIDVIFMGRKSYELAGTSMFPDQKSYVFSNTLKEVKGAVGIIGSDWLEKVNEIKNQDGKNIWLFGGASLTTDFINHQLVDEMWLGLVPVILGAGKPLFQNINQRQIFIAEKASASNGYFSLTLTRKKTEL
jgi:dihydrofolate reductase